MVDFNHPEHGWNWLHGSLNPTCTATGRWSSRAPNLQNISKGESVYKSRNSKWEVAPRDAIMAPEGWHIVTADYSQIELRVAAGESGCKSWTDAFRNGDDVHSASGAAVHGVPIEQVTKKQRADGKTFNFALLFGQEVKSTAVILGVPVAEAQRMQKNYWDGLPEVKAWIDRTQALARHQEYIETKFGRRRALRGINSEDVWIQRENLRESVNTVVQGTAADILKIGLRRQEETAKRYGAKLFLVVHDQYVWLVPDEVNPREFCEAMDKVINFEIEGYPEMVSDYSIGKRFNSLVDFETASAVPETWAEVFVGFHESDGVVIDEVLHIEIPSLNMKQLTEISGLLDANRGSRKVVLAIEALGVERELDYLTSLTTENELEIRAALGNAAKVRML